MSKTSIVILTYNQLEYTKLCIDSIRRHTRPGSYELIVVDNLSTDGTRDWLAEQTDIRTIFNEENAGFPKGCNQGMELATGEYIMLLNNDTIVTANWLNYLVDCLTSSNDIGAVGPVTNNAYQYQTIPVQYQSIDEMHQFARNYNKPSPEQWEQRLKLIGFCMLMKREVIERVGMLDEQFFPGMCEDSDYCFRMIEAGYRLMLCTNVFIHHFGSASFGEMKEHQYKLLLKNRKKFFDKWGFHTSESVEIRHDLVQLMDSRQANLPIRVLDIGCACGATLVEIQNKFKHAELYGIDHNRQAIQIAARFANAKAVDAEQELDYPADFFDYILLGNVLEHLNDPWKLLKQLFSLLKEDGKILASIPNIMHHHNVRNLLQGQWAYTGGDSPERRQLRFFTAQDMVKMFNEAGYEKCEFGPVSAPLSTEDEQWLQQLRPFMNEQFLDQMKATQYLLRVYKTEPVSTLHQKLKDIENEVEQNQHLETLAMYVKENNIDPQSIINGVNHVVQDKQKIYNLLANTFYKYQLYERIIPLLQASLQINDKHTDSLYNLGVILYQVGERKGALQFLEMIEDKDAEIMNLINTIKNEIK